MINPIRKTNQGLRGQNSTNTNCMLRYAMACELRDLTDGDLIETCDMMKPNSIDHTTTDYHKPQGYSTIQQQLLYSITMQTLFFISKFKRDGTTSSSNLSIILLQSAKL